MIHNRKYLNLKKTILLLVFIPLLFSCEGLWEPAIENLRDIESVEKEAVLAQAILGHAYLGNPLGGWSFNDVATDDAVSNDRTNGYMRIATGQWRANNSPMNGNWQSRRASIQYINLFLDMLSNNKTVFANDPVTNGMFKDRLMGDAYGMRALFMYHLVLEHAGYTDDGQLLGIPILLKPENLDSDFNLPRNTLKVCIDQIYADVQVACDNLPLRYPNISNDADVPSKYRSQNVTAAEYMRVFGEVNAGGRMDALIAQAIRAQATLLAASPAYRDVTGVTWKQAANEMANVLSSLGSNPVSQIDPIGGTWYDNSEVNTLAGGRNPKEILWRGNVGDGRSLEEDHFPPTLFGRGRLNPTQNLVDAFPMANGYPITENASGYNPNNPYNGRDPRLGKYIIYNNSSYKSTNIITAEDGTGNNALNRVETSTRTGYYMKKHLRPEVNADPSSPNDRRHYKAFIRYTEIFLGYAEAANEEWGPIADGGGHGYTAYDVIKAIRARAGITGGDAYLESIKNDKDKMRELIRNERRLELCFEGHRFWDLRRWKAPITETAKGMRIAGETYTPFDVEQRQYLDYMYHAPIPYSEILKFSNLKQNKGW
jgi:hypothetical protein